MGGHFHIDLVAALAGRQAGRVARAQLLHLGLTAPTIESWLVRGLLRKLLPGVYAFGHAAPSYEGDLWAAILYAGPGAMLSHLSAAHHLDLIEYPPRGVVQVTTPRQIRSIPGIKIYGRRACPRIITNGLPTTTVPQTLLDLAAMGEERLIRKALGRLDYRDELDTNAIAHTLTTGAPGSRLLRAALTTYDPQFARTNGQLEYDFYARCVRWDIRPLALINPVLHGEQVDAHWPHANLVVELDGKPNHSSPAQIKRDRARELKLRAHGLVVIRYDWDLIHAEPKLVRADLTTQLKAGPPPPPASRPGS